jgi:hypothetical protein
MQPAARLRQHRAPMMPLNAMSGSRRRHPSSLRVAGTIRGPSRRVALESLRLTGHISKSGVGRVRRGITMNTNQPAARPTAWQAVPLTSYLVLSRVYLWLENSGNEGFVIVSGTPILH